MWNKINSPIVITIIAIVSLFVLKATMKPRLASEVRGVYEELNAIIKDSASDAEKSKAVLEFAQEIATQMREGFSAGIKTNDSENKDKIYIATKAKIDISGIKLVKSQWPERERFIFVIKNNSDKCIGQLKLSYEYYRHRELIDCENKWVSEVKILEPGEEVALSEDRALPKEETESYGSDEVKVKITSFDIKQTG